MASTYTAAGIELIAQGEQAGAWGNTTNTNWQLVEEMVGGVVDITLTGASYSLSTSDGASSEGRHSVLNFSGSPGATCTVTVTPNDMQKVYFVVNGSDQTVTISQGTGANVSVSAGKNKIVFCDGAGTGAAVTDISSGFDATTLTELGVTASASELNTLDGITATTAELNTLDGVTATTAELNKLDGVTATTTELNYVDGVTSSIQTQLDAMVEKAGDTMTGALTLPADPTSALHAATKQYVDTQTSAGIHYHDPVRGEVGSNLNATYDNGSSGVGATLTNAGTLAAFAAGGISDWSTTERVLIYGQTDKTQNGIYTVTTVGDGSTAWVLTRSTDTDSYGASDPDGLGEGDAFYVQEGDGAGELYVMTSSGTITFGTTNITFSQISSAAIYSAGSGLDLTGTTFSHTDTSSQASVNNSGNTFIQDVTLDGFGHVTALTSATAVINDGTLTMATSGTGLSGSASFTANDSDNVTFTVTSNATNANTASTIVARDASGNFSAGTITANLTGNASGSSGSCTGNAATATKLATARTISLTGDVSGSASFDGSANASITATIADDSHNHVTGNIDGLSEYIADTVGAMVTSNTESGISVTYDDADNTLDFNVNDPTITLTGAVTGSGTLTNLGNLSIATTATSDPTLTLAGDASGSATFTNLGNATLTVTVADDSHNHVTGNIDGLSEYIADTVGAMVTSNTESGISVTYDDADNTLDFNVNDPTITLTGAVTGSGTMTNLGNLSIATTATSDPTLTLSGDVTGSATFTNLGNATLTATVANDSHTHDGRYYTESELGANGTSNSTSGAYKIGTYDEFANSNSTNVQDVLDDLDAAISGKQASGSYAVTTNNLSDLSSASTARTNLGLGSLATLSTVNAATITDNSVGAAELNVSGNGTSGQYLSSDGDGSFSWGSPAPTAGAGIDVSGSTVSVESDLRADCWQIGRDTNDYYIVNTTNHSWYLDGVLDMQLTNAGTLHCDGDIVAYSTTTSSDEKLKGDIEVVADALNKVNELRGVTFNWKRDGSASAGVIAQDVLKVLPCAVTEVEELNTDDSHLTVNYSALTSLLIEAIKELTKRVEELEAK